MGPGNQQRPPLEPGDPLPARVPRRTGSGHGDSRAAVQARAARGIRLDRRMRGHPRGRTAALPVFRPQPHAQPSPAFRHAAAALRRTGRTRGSSASRARGPAVDLHRARTQRAGTEPPRAGSRQSGRAAVQRRAGLPRHARSHRRGARLHLPDDLYPRRGRNGASFLYGPGKRCRARCRRTRAHRRRRRVVLVAARQQAAGPGRRAEPPGSCRRGCCHLLFRSTCAITTKSSSSTTTWASPAA